MRQVNLADVPGRLRALADELEREGVRVRACVCVIDHADNSGLAIPTFGPDGDLLRTIGLLTLAASKLTASIE